MKQLTKPSKDVGQPPVEPCFYTTSCITPFFLLRRTFPDEPDRAFAVGDPRRTLFVLKILKLPQLTQKEAISARS